MPGAVYLFGEFGLDCGRYQLSRNGRVLRLERKPLELLALLVTRHGQVVTRDEIARHLWEQEVFVDVEHGINTAIRKIRQTLGDSPDQPRFVQTLSGSGYRFVATVSVVEPEATAERPESGQSSAEPVAAAAESLQTPDLPAEPNAASPEIPVRPDAPDAPDTKAKRKPGYSAWLMAAACIAVAITLAILGRQAALLSHRNNRAAIGSIAVLPLQNLSGDPAQQYFADGMTDELITELAHIPKLRVVSRTSVMAGRDSNRSLPEIARQLDVDAVVEGSIVRSGDRIRITAQLIDARTDRHLWAQSFEGSAADVLSIQDSVAQQIATQASFVLAPPSPRAPVNPAAYDAYLRGRYFFNKQDFSRSLASFKQAVDLDPGYASAHAGYASALEAATTFNIGSPDEVMPRALAEARRAIQIDPQNGEAYTDIGSVQTIYEWDWPAAEQNLSRGIALSPSDAIAEFKYAVYLDAIGRTQDAITHMRRAVQLDPLSFLIHLRLGVALYYDRQYDAAIVQLQRAAEMERSAGSVERYLSLVYEQKGDRDNAVQYYLAGQRKIEPQLDTEALLSLYRQRGWQSYWRVRSRTLSTSANPCIAYEIGVDELRIGEIGQAFDSFQPAVDRHCFSMAFIRVSPLFDAVRGDPRFAALLRRIHQ